MAEKRPVALVTGASRGIGKSAAVELAKAGYDVAVSARTIHEGEGRHVDGTVLPGSLDTTVAEIEAAGAKAFAVRMDVLDHQSLVDGAAAVIEHFGGVDVLVNNGIYQGNGTMVPFLDVDFSDMRKIFEGNVFGQLVLIREVLPTMVERGGGTIMNMISATAYRDPPGKIGQGGWGMVVRDVQGGVRPRRADARGRARRGGDPRVQHRPRLRRHRDRRSAGDRRAVRRPLRRRHAAGDRRRDRLARDES